MPEFVTFRGNLFNNTKRAFAEAANEFLEDVAMMGQIKVSDELYKPAGFPRVRHGFDSGILKGRIGSGLVKNLHATVDAGRLRYGSNINYVNWVEGIDPKNARTSFKGYGMFRNAYNWLRKAPKEIDDIARQAILRKFQ